MTGLLMVVVLAAPPVFQAEPASISLASGSAVSRPLLVGGEALAALVASGAAMLGASWLIINADLGSPTRFAASFALLSMMPPLAAATAGWGVGKLDREHQRRWWTALAGAAAGEALAVAGYLLALNARAVTPAEETAIALIVLIAGGPLLSAAGAVVGLELHRLGPVQPSLTLARAKGGQLAIGPALSVSF